MRNGTIIDVDGTEYTEKEWKKIISEDKEREDKRKKRNKEIPKLKYYLKSAWYWQKKKDKLSEEILKLRSRAEKVTTTFSDAPSFGGYEDHRQSVIAEMVDKQNLYKSAKGEYDDKLKEIQLFIDQLDDYQERIVLDYRYIWFENWQDIAYKLNYTERQVYKIHGRALLHLLEIHRKMINVGGKELF